MDYSYVSLGEAFGNKYTYATTQDKFPFYNDWRGRPLSDIPYIKPNVAGYYPYPKQRKILQVRPEPEWQSNWGYGSTLFPSNPQFSADRTIILER